MSLHLGGCLYLLLAYIHSQTSLIGPSVHTGGATYSFGPSNVTIDETTPNDDNPTSFLRFGDPNDTASVVEGLNDSPAADYAAV